MDSKFVTIDDDSDSDGYPPPPVLKKAVPDDEGDSSDSELLDLPDENGKMPISFFERMNIAEKPKPRKRKRSTRNDSCFWSLSERTICKSTVAAAAGSPFNIVDLVEKQKRPMKTPKKRSNLRNPSKSPSVQPVETIDLAEDNDITITKQTPTFQLIRDSSALLAGVNLMNKMCSKKLSGEEVRGRLGIKQPRLARSPSPDICSFSSKSQREKKAKELIEARVKKELEQEAIIEARNKLEELKFDDTNENESQEMDESMRERGESILRELVTRSSQSTLKHDLKVEDFDMSGSFELHDELYSDYGKKNKLLKQHAKNVTEMTVEELTAQFEKIKPDLRNIYNGVLASERHTLFLDGDSKKSQLRSMNVSVPFDSDQGCSLFYLLFEFLVPDQEERPKWTDYINFVMLPESFVRIYASLNHISLKHAETELRFGACYDGPLFK